MTEEDFSLFFDAAIDVQKESKNTLLDDSRGVS